MLRVNYAYSYTYTCVVLLNIHILMFMLILTQNYTQCLYSYCTNTHREPVDGSKYLSFDVSSA